MPDGASIEAPDRSQPLRLLNSLRPKSLRRRQKMDPGRRGSPPKSISESIGARKLSKPLQLCKAFKPHPAGTPSVSERGADVGREAIRRKPLLVESAHCGRFDAAVGAAARGHRRDAPARIRRITAHDRSAGGLVFSAWSGQARPEALTISGPAGRMRPNRSGRHALAILASTAHRSDRSGSHGTRRPGSVQNGRCGWGCGIPGKRSSDQSPLGAATRLDDVVGHGGGLVVDPDSGATTVDVLASRRT